MDAEPIADQQPTSSPRIDWESFYSSYRKPGYVPGYEILNKLGGGVFGMVFKARKESIGKHYAIKFLKVDDEVVRDAVLRELQSVRFFAQIDHPNLVSIEDKGEIDGIPYIIMSYAGDDTLRKRLTAGRLTREFALRAFIQAARGVQALHEHSLVHFDLKPANIFLKGDIARVGDYGLSKLITESRNSLSFGRGTPYYMAPEMLQRRGDAQSDIYSLGVILYECLTGDVPFKGDSEWEVLRKHETEPPRFPESVAEPERSVIARCLAKQPEERFRSVAELLHALEAPAALGESMVIPPSRSVAPPAPASQAFASTPEPSAAPAPAAAPAGGPPFGDSPARTTIHEPGSPQSMPWQRESSPAGGVFGGGVRLMVRAIELLIALTLLPVRILSVGVGRLIVLVLRLPFQVIGFALTLTGYLLVAAVLVALILGVILLLSNFL